MSKIDSYKEYGKKGKIKYRKSSRIELDCEIKEET